MRDTSAYLEALDSVKARKVAEAIHRIYQKAVPGKYYKASELWKFAGFFVNENPPNFIRNGIAYCLPQLGWRRVCHDEGNYIYHYPLDANRVEATEWQRIPAKHRR